MNKEEIIEILKTCYDPEIPIDLWNLGLIYDIKIKKNDVYILMTLTTPGCTMAESIANDIKNKISNNKLVEKIEVEITFDPIWTPEMMTDEGRVKLGFNKREENEQSWE
tara:strand:- start:1061 stop:1387 length:327 start_codon:yes stop_codon:yes gene_type:complete